MHLSFFFSLIANAWASVVTLYMNIHELSQIASSLLRNLLQMPQHVLIRVGLSDGQYLMQCLVQSVDSFLYKVDINEWISAKALQESRSFVDVTGAETPRFRGPKISSSYF